MARILTITMEVNDVEAATLLNHIAERGGVSVSPPPNGVGHDTTDGPADPNAPSTDKDGIPWDSRIHSSNKKQNQDGTWRRARGVTDDEYNKVVAELKGSHPTSAATVTEAASSTPIQTSAPAPVVTELAPTMPGLPGTGLPHPAEMSPPAPAPVTYEDVVAKFKELSEAGKITNENYKESYDKAGVTDVQALTTDESLRRKLMDVFNAL